MISNTMGKIIFSVSMGVGTWAVYQIFAEAQYLRGGILLAYVGLVICSQTKRHDLMPRS